MVSRLTRGTEVTNLLHRVIIERWRRGVQRIGVQKTVSEEALDKPWSLCVPKGCNHALRHEQLSCTGRHDGQLARFRGQQLQQVSTGLGQKFRTALQHSARALSGWSSRV